MRTDQRSPSDLRKVSIETGVMPYAEGSALISMGDTRVLCAASIEERVPPFMKGSGKGWVTAEYAMLPRSTLTRKERDARKGRIDGRAQEIQRLVGRSLRAAVDMALLGERMITVDCDVLQADGGTRTAAITGGYVALALAIGRLVESAVVSGNPLIREVAAVSVGLISGEVLLDLCYREDSVADTDLNCVATSDGNFIEIQGTAEKIAFDREELDWFLLLAEKGIKELMAFQQQALEEGKKL